jgi:shikimate kinase
MLNHLIPDLKGVSIFLVGMMGVGKTTVGKRLAQFLNYGFCDTDSLIEAVTHQSIKQIFTEQGEEHFRSIEQMVLVQVSAYPRLVVATGGGIVLRSENWAHLHHGLVVWLDLDMASIVTRLQADPEQMHQRPLLQSADPLPVLHKIYQNRLPYYAQADIHLDARGTPEEICERLFSLLPKVLKPSLNS